MLFTNGKGAYSYTLGMHTVFSILYFNRQTAKMQQLRRERQFECFFLEEIRGSKVGILGYGDIGREAARMLQPLGLEVTGLRRSLDTPGRDEYDVLQVCGDAAMERIIAESDYLVNLLPKTPQTEGLFNVATFAKMKRTAVYINLGRGDTQKDSDLAAALRDGVIAGASLDVVEVEPLPPSSPLFDIDDDKLLLTPHNACMTTESFKGAIKRFVKLAKQFLETGALEGVYKPHLEEGY
ncbi:D-isomer specific 2-hydroxyacid dehydrogenase-protein [Strigomonas culicis]|uniref:D-isomer specific 2-hydroxyacid dehydrogenase-protein n=1 Tax=Strigomonas culicis TaxID=28005 RepID=S9V2R5_9TRYP|nr:D-isomer specific 2-hydroxyacid dehydrogenase-protein [Strigomonas culicis]|eukprot:EPY35258.1 D-isomer specific 2-hydroxyacid dehydrogenase-protein [Strigomonas culicis]